VAGSGSQTSICPIRPTNPMSLDSQPQSSPYETPALAAEQLAPVVEGQPGTDPASDDGRSAHHRRNGRVAQLPKVLRDQINQMILDGVPYTKILETIGDPVKHINPDNLSEWKKGGYPEWLIEMQRADDLGATRDAALSLVEKKAGATVQDAGRTIASAQLYELLLSFDPRGFAAALADKPELYFRLVNALSRLSEGEAVCSRRRAQGSLIEGQLGAVQDDKGEVVIPADKLNQIIRLIKLL
jgi:hypothetical protein